MTQLLMAMILALVVSIATYNDSLQGSQTAAPEAEGIALNLTATGDLPGMSKLKLQRNGQNVTGGSFHITVLPQNADASSSERGELVGTITGGTVTVTTEGTLSAASGVQITIQSGTGEFASEVPAPARSASRQTARTPRS